MTWLRYLGISILKWISIYVTMLLFVTYVAPSWLKGYWLALPMWALTLLIAYGFGYWALHFKIPARREIAILIGVWMVTTICIEIWYEILTIGRPVFLMHSIDLYVQYLIEIVGILLAARMIRAHKYRVVSGEGIAL